MVKKRIGCGRRLQWYASVPHLGHFSMLFRDLGHFCMVSLKSWHTPYFRFRKIFPPSLYSPVTYSKPTSIKEHACSALWAIHVMNLSLGKFLNSFFSSWMYNRVFLSSLWQRNSTTSSMSGLQWYSIVAFQCLSVWKWISFTRGFPA